MITTIIRRLLQGLVVVFAVMVITFIMLRLIPGDPSRVMAPIATAAQTLQLKEQMGIGESIPVQFGKYMQNLFHGYLGYSLFQKADVTTVIGNALPKTGILFLFAIFIELTFGVLFGVLAAVKSKSQGTVTTFTPLFERALCIFLLAPQSINKTFFADLF